MTFFWEELEKLWTPKKSTGSIHNKSRILELLWSEVIIKTSVWIAKSWWNDPCNSTPESVGRISKFSVQQILRSKGFESMQCQKPVAQSMTQWSNLQTSPEAKKVHEAKKDPAPLECRFYPTIYRISNTSYGPIFGSQTLTDSPPTTSSQGNSTAV